MADDLTTLAAVKNWLGLAGADSEAGADDALLTGLIGAASGFIRAWCGRTLTRADFTEIRDGTGATRLTLRETPVRAVSALSIDGRAVPAAAAVPGSPGYRFSSSTLVLAGYYFSPGVGNVVIVYSAGYETVPADLAQACIELVGQRFRDKDRIGLVSKGLAGETTQYSQRDLPAPVRAVLESYKRVVPL